MGFPGTFARLKSRLRQMAEKKVRYGPNGPGNQAPGRSTTMVTRTVSPGRYSMKFRSTCMAQQVCNWNKCATGGDQTPKIVPWGWGQGRKKYYFLSLKFYEKNIFYLSTFLNSNKKTYRVNTDLNQHSIVLKQSSKANIVYLDDFLLLCYHIFGPSEYQPFFSISAVFEVLGKGVSTFFERL